MKKENTKYLLLALICILSSGLVLSVIAIQYRGAGDGIRAGSAGMFRMFTNDGNLFSAAAALLCGVCCLRCLIVKKSINSRAIYCLRLMSAVSEVIIFFIVAAVLMPMGMRFLLSGYSMFVLHALVPLLTVLSFLFLDPKPLNTGKAAFLYGAIPVFVYGLTALILCIAKVWTGNRIPYPFFRVYDNPVRLTAVSLAGILGAALLLSFALDRIKQKTARRTKG